MEVWPKRFPTIASALPYARNPQGLSNKVYANRLGNGDEASGDGYRYRGRGLIMVTGRDNYTQVDEGLGLRGTLLANPDLLTRREYAALSAALFWSRRPKLNELADDTPVDDDDADFAAITKIVQGAHHGLVQRRVYWQRTKKALGA